MLYFGFGILYSVCSAEAVQYIAMQKLTVQQFTVVCEVGGDTVQYAICSAVCSTICGVICSAVQSSTIQCKTACSGLDRRW